MAKTTDIKLGYDCNNNCVHCVIADQRAWCKRSGIPENRSTQEYIYEINDSKNNGYNAIVFTGGEPTIRKDILYLLAYAKSQGFDIQMQTNGRIFFYKNYAQKFIPFNISYIIALHGPNKGIHESITRAKNSYNQTVKGIQNLKEFGAIKLYGKTVISCFNYQYLPEIAELFLKLGMNGMNFAFPHPNGNAWTHFDEVVPKYKNIMPYVYKSIKIIEKHNNGKQHKVGINFEAIPFCLMVGYEKYVSEIHFINRRDTELKQLDSSKQSWDIVRKQIKSKFSQCKYCKYYNICEGVWKEYPQKRGSEEFKPVV